MGLEFALGALVTVFVVIDPFANLPVFVALLERFSPAQRAATVRKAHLVAFGVMLVFTFAGQALLDFLGVELYALRIAGGVLLFGIALEMLYGRRSRTEYSEAEEEEAKQLERIAASPLAVPLITGPGAISTGILLRDSAATTVDQGLLLGAIALAFVGSYLLLARAEPIFARLGVTGTTVVTRIMGLLLASVAVQYIAAGLREVFRLA